MSTLTLPAPATFSTGAAETDHIYRCDDKDRALCGADLAGEPECPVGCGHPLCPLCEAVDESDLHPCCGREL